MTWTTEKPKIDKPCMLIVMYKFKDELDYSFFEIVFSDWDGLVVTMDGGYYGEIDEVQGTMYCVVPLPDLKT